ncbi:MAG: ABC transporter ATP-binding protein [Selenomonadales bacterium]|nr:ABC transporter ATP-binding protein [Selenomonadales bacterium]
MNKRNSYKRLFSYIRPYTGRLIMAMVCAMLAAGANLYVPWLIKGVIDQVLADKDMMMLNLIAISIVVAFFLRGVFLYGQHYLMSYIAQKVIIDVRDAIYRKLQKLPISYFEKRQTGTVMSYVTNDVAAMQAGLADHVIDMITEGVILIGSFAMMCWLHWKLTLLTLIIVPLVGYTMNIFGRKLKQTSFTMQERVADITSLLQEALSAIRVIRSFVREEYEIQRFANQNQANFIAQMKNAKLMSMLAPVVEFLAAISVTLILWYGGMEVIDGHLTAGALIAFLVYAVNLSNPIKRLSRVYGNIQKAIAAAERVFAVLDTEEEITDAPDAKKMPIVKGNVKLTDVKFSYVEGELAIKGISMEAQPGQMIAIVGASGSGKSTIANLIPRFYDIQSGSIEIDGYDIRSVTQRSLREQIGIVPQETVLFNGSVYDNIRYGNLDATKEEIIAAAKAANAHEFITQMTDGYETQIGERGALLSGGQRQRIAIARAILKDPQILILDEATSALDTESEKIVQEALDKLLVGRTSFVIAHRLSTIVRADVIIVMERGVIVERGTHEELLEKGGIYSKLHQMQQRDKQEEN